MSNNTKNCATDDTVLNNAEVVTSSKQKKCKALVSKKSKKTEHTLLFWFFIIFVAAIAFSAIAWLGSISSGFPWLVLCGGCAVIAEQLAVFLWGYHSHKPQVKVKVQYVYIATPANHNLQTEPMSQQDKDKMLNAIYYDPDLANDPQEEGLAEFLKDLSAE